MNLGLRDLLRQPLVMVLGGIDRLGGDALEDVALATQLRDAGLDVLGRPERLVDFAGLPQQTTLLPPLGENDEPGIGGHQRQEDQGALRDEVALRPQCGQSVGVIDRNSLGAHGGVFL